MPEGTAASPPRWKRIAAALRHYRLRLAAALVILFAALYTAVGGESEAGEKPLTAEVQRGDIENTVTAAGSLQPSHSVDVGAQVSGQLEKLFVEVGDTVEQGQLLAQIDASVKEQQVAASRAGLTALEAQRTGRKAAVRLAQANAERQERMLRERATSQQDFDTAFNSLISAQSSLAQLEAQIQQSRASLASDEAELGYTKIYAPMAGTVVSVAIKEGQTLNAAQTAPTVLTIADLSVMTVETQVSEADVSKLENGMPAYFTTLGSGERRWRGQLEQVLPIPTVNNNVVLYTGLFDVPNGDGTLRSSMTAQVFFVTSSARDVLTVPVAALTYRRGPGPEAVKEAGDAPGPGGSRPPSGSDFKPPEQGERPSFRRAALRESAKSGSPRRRATVRVIAEDGSEEVREVVVGVTSRVSAEVISGLEEGERVVAGIVQAAGRANSGNRERSGPRRFGGF